MIAFVLIAALSLGFAQWIDQDPAENEPQPEQPRPVLIGGVGSTQFEYLPVRTLNEIQSQRLVRQRYDYSCGSAALTTILRYYLDKPLDEAAVINGLLRYGEVEQIIERRGFSLLDMKRFAAALGLRSQGFTAEFADLVELDRPGIVPITYGGFNHFVVLREIVDGHVILGDPAFGNIAMTPSQFMEAWSPQAIFIVYPESPDEGYSGPLLTEAQLRFIGEDRIRWTALRQIPEFQDPVPTAVIRDAGL